MVHRWVPRVLLLLLYHCCWLLMTSCISAFLGKPQGCGTIMATLQLASTGHGLSRWTGGLVVVIFPPFLQFQAVPWWRAAKRHGSVQHSGVFMAAMVPVHWLTTTYLRFRETWYTTGCRVHNNPWFWVQLHGVQFNRLSEVTLVKAGSDQHPARVKSKTIIYHENRHQRVHGSSLLRHVLVFVLQNVCLKINIHTCFNSQVCVVVYVHTHTHAHTCNSHMGPCGQHAVNMDLQIS